MVPGARFVGTGAYVLGYEAEDDLRPIQVVIFPRPATHGEVSDRHSTHTPGEWMEFSQDAARYDSFMVYQKKVRATGINLWVSGNKVTQGDCLIEKNPIAVIA